MAEEQAYAQLQQKIDDLQSQISNQNQQISTLDAAIGQQAAQQYRNGGLSNTLELTLSASPTTYLDKVTSENEIASQEAMQLKSIATDQAELRQEQALAATLIQQQQAALTQAKAAKTKADTATANAKQLVADLTPAQQEQVTIGSGSGTDGMWTHYSGTLPGGLRPRLGRRRLRRIETRRRVRLRGGTGPNEFDCSGLTMEAWLAAGVSIPRAPLRAVRRQLAARLATRSCSRATSSTSAATRPSHVALYVGNGMYIQATHPGAYVEWASLDPSSAYYVNMAVTGYTSVD